MIKLSPRTKILVWSFKLFITLAAVFFLSYLIDWNKLVTLTYSAKLNLLVIAGLLVFPNIFFTWQKWDYMVRFVDKKILKRKTFISVMSGMALDTITLSPIGDYGGRLLTHLDLPKGSLVSLQFFEKIQLLFISTLFGSASLLYFATYYVVAGSTQYYVIFSMGIVFLAFSFGGFYVFLKPSRYERLVAALRFIPKKFIDEAVEVVKSIKDEDVNYILIINNLKYFTFILQFYLFINAFTPISLIDGFAGATATMLIRSVLSGLTLGDLGIREASSVFFFSFVGVSVEVATYSALLLFIVNRFLPALIGIFILLISDIQSSQIPRRIVRLRKYKRTGSDRTQPSGTIKTNS